MTHRGPFQPLPFCDSVKSNFYINVLSQKQNFFETDTSFYRVPTLLILHKLVILECYTGGKGQSMKL